MNVEPMDYSCRLDTNNFDDEIKYRLTNGDINRADLIDFLADGFITSQQFLYYIDYLDYLEED